MKEIKNNSFEELMLSIDGFANDIAVEVAQKRFYEMDEVRAIIKVRLVVALTDCATIKTTKYDDIIDELKTEKANCSDGKRDFQINGQLSTLKIARRKVNRLRHELKDWSEHELLKVFINEKFGSEIMKEYYVIQDKFRDGSLQSRDELLSMVIKNQPQAQ